VAGDPAGTGRVSSLPSLGPRGEGWVLIQIVLFWLVIATGVGFAGAWTREARSVTTVVGVLVGLAGLALALKGLVDLRGALTPLPRPRDDAELVETGVYGLVRHPVYGGLVIAAVGWGLFTASFVALLVTAVLLGFFRLKSGREEAWLRERYPGYAGYAARTRRMIPLVY
jgi:protein-S-isoprenylcysteine O-methyltransferase Ste14